MKKISINLKINRGEILNELTRRSSFTALAMLPHEGKSEGLSDKIILSSDEYPWCEEKIKRMFYKVRDLLTPFSLNEDEFALLSDTELSYKLTVKSDTIDSVKYYIKEMIINYILSEWFVDRIPEKAAYLAQQYENMQSILRITLNKSLGTLRLPTNYI